MIPQHFSDVYLQGAHGEVKIQTTDGMTWVMNLQTDERGSCFSTGWRRFSRWYKLRAGQLLFFTVGVDLNFNVWIFDQHTFCEKEMPQMPQCLIDGRFDIPIPFDSDIDTSYYIIT